MLTISGTEGQGQPIYQHRKSSHDGVLGRIENVVAGYQERLSVLDRLVKRDVVEQGVELQGLGLDVGKS